jgi:hypothetical protein
MHARKRFARAHKTPYPLPPHHARLWGQIKSGRLMVSINKMAVVGETKPGAPPNVRCDLAAAGGPGRLPEGKKVRGRSRGRRPSGRRAGLAAVWQRARLRRTRRAARRAHDARAAPRRPPQFFLAPSLVSVPGSATTKQNTWSSKICNNVRRGAARPLPAMGASPCMALGDWRL